MYKKLLKIAEKMCLILLGAAIASAVFIFLFSDLYKYKDLDQVLKQVSKSSYDQTDYNCVDFSQDAEQKLEQKNIGSNIIVVKKNDVETHALVSVWFDAQNGSLASKTQFLGDYSELKTKLGWADR